MKCTRCDGLGIINIPDDVDISELDLSDEKAVGDFLEKHRNTDVSICDCCGNGEVWYGVPGEHYGSDDPIGENGPYAYNGGLCECH